MSPPPNEPVNSFGVYPSDVTGMDMYNPFAVGAAPSVYSSMSVSDWRSSQLGIDNDLHDVLDWSAPECTIDDMRGQ
jgi:hypothetical protein